MLWGLTCRVFPACIVGHAEIVFKLFAWSHLQAFSSIASWLTQKRLSDWVRGFSSIVSWLTQKRLSDWLRGLSCRAFLDRIVAHAEMSLRLVTWSHPQRFPRPHRGSRTNVFQSGYAAPPAEFSSIASWLTQERRSDWLRGLTCKDLLDRIVPHAKTSLRSPRIDLLRRAKLS